MQVDGTSGSCSTATECYVYDGDGQRLEKATSSVSKIYWYGSSGSVLDETDGSASLQNEYVFFNGARIGRRDSSSNIFYHFADQLGTAREIVQSGSSSPCYDADFYPYGGERAYINSCPTPNNYKFTGKERDSESNLDNLGARYNSSQYGRFVSPDPGNAGADPTNPQSRNAYAYVMNNPMIFIDPTGLECVWDDGSYDSNDDPDTGTPKKCQNSTNGGTWVDHSYFVNNNLGDWSPDANSDLAGIAQRSQDAMSGGCPKGALCSNSYADSGSDDSSAVPQTMSSKALAVLACAEKQADHYSIAGLLGAQKGTFLGNAAHAFGGNSVSGLIDVAGHMASTFKSVSAGDSHGRSVGILNVYTDLLVGGTAQGVLTSGAGNPFAQGLVGTATDALFGTLADTVGSVKLGVDFAIFAASAFSCAAHQ